MHGIDPRLLRRAGAVRRLLAADAALGLLTALCVLLQAVLIARVAARGFSGAGLAELAAPLALLVAVAVARGGTAWGFEVVGRRAADGVISQLRRDVVRRRLRDDPGALRGAESGALATAAVSGVDALETTFARAVPQVVLAVCVPVAVLVVAAVIDPLTAGLMLLTLPLVPVFMWLLGRMAERRARERWQALALLSNHFLDVVRGLPTLRAFNRGRAQATEVARVGDEYRRATMGTLRLAFLSGAVLELAATLGIALVAVTVGVRLVDGGIGFEPALTVLLLTPELYLPLRNLGAQFHASADGLAVAAKLLDEIDAPPSVTAGRRTPPSPRDAPVRLEHVSFAYPAREALVLDDVSLVLSPGESVALVGASGAGKSTIAALLLRLADPDRGRVLAGDDDLAACAADAWRRHLAWVPQRPTLVRGTVADNVRLGVPVADDDAVAAAVALAGADDVVARLPEGLATLVGDGGRALSAGERRRLALARAFLRDAALVVLDEPTADLDPAAASAIADAVDRLRVGRTVLLIAHRAELAERADRVLRLEHGRIAAEREAA